MPLNKEKRKIYMKEYNQKYRKKNRIKLLKIMSKYYFRNKANPEFMKRRSVNRKKSRLYKRYRMTTEQYSELLLKQQSVCAICDSNNNNKTLHVDHCHKSKKIRGLLCSKCNHGIGLFDDNIKLLSNAIIYLIKTRGKVS